MKTTLEHTFSRIERELAVLLLANQRAIEESGLREKARRSESQKMDQELLERSITRRDAAVKEARQFGKELQAERERLVDLAAELGIEGPTVGFGVAGLTAEKVDRLAYLCCAFGEQDGLLGADEEEWRRRLEWALDDAKRASYPELDRRDWEAKAAILEFAAFLQSSSVELGDAQNLVRARINGSAPRSERLLKGVQRPDSAIFFGREDGDAKKDICLWLKDSLLFNSKDESGFMADLQALRRTDGESRAKGGSERFYQEFRAAGKSWKSFSESLEERRERRMAEGRGCLLSESAEAAIRAEIVRMRRLGDEARTNGMAARQFDGDIQGSESVIRAAAASVPLPVPGVDGAAAIAEGGGWG